VEQAASENVEAALSCSNVVKMVIKIRICDRFSRISKLGAPMKQLLAASLVLLFYVSPVQPQKSAGQPSSQAGLDAASAELSTLTNAWTEAINANDRVKLEAFLAPEFAAYGWNGELWATRSKWLDNVHYYSDNALHEISPKVYGDFAIVTSVTTFVVTYEGRPAANKTSILVDTWRRINGRWQVVTRTICRTGSASASTANPCG
jgi:ketosteroid isomerase-like protein